MYTLTKEISVASFYYLQILFGPITSKYANLGFEEVFVPRYVITGVLGSGLSSSVYVGQAENAPAEDRVIKIFKHFEDYEREARSLTILRQEQSAIKIPVIYDRMDDLLVLVVGPVGLSVRPVPGGRPVCGRQLADLVEPLEIAHRCHIAHRDVKPQNIFIRSDDSSIFLNDWGSSCDLNSQQRFVGTYGYCDPHISGHAQVCSAEADLRGLVRSAYAMYTGLSPPHDCEAAVGFWSEVLKDGTIWRRAMDCADHLLYDELRALLFQL